MKKHPFVFLFLLSLLLAVSSSAKIGRDYQMQLGNPSSSQIDPNNHDNYLIQRDQYAMDYSDHKGEPNWVSWDLSAEDIGSSGRSDFAVDTTLPSGFYRVLTSDYSGSGYDRGHMCPSADRTVTVADNKIVFFMSNMIPQAPDNNQGVWANFENYCRSLTSDGSELLITAGPSHFGGSRLPSNAAAIPGYVWKIVVVVPPGSGMAIDRITDKTRVIAISIPNVAGVRSDPWQNYVTSVAQIEAETGLTFFTQLPSSVASALRQVIDGQPTVGLPVFTLHPVSQSAALGGSATFTAAATGDGTISYQWFKDDELIPGATSPTLTLTNIQALDAGSYDCSATNSVGSAVSNAAALVVTGIPPSIVSNPLSQSVTAGGNVTLTVSVSGSPTLSYQWRKNGVVLSGATTPTLALVNVQSANAGSYDVVVSNANGTATSAAATLAVVDAAPSFTSQPVSRTAAIGSTQSLSVTATGTAPISYAWYKDGTALSDGGIVSGTASAQLTLAGISAADAGSYTAVATNSLGSATSSAATLTVTTASIYWDFTTATPTSGLPADVTGGTVTQGNNNGTTALLTTTSASSGYTGVSGTYNAGAAARIGALSQDSGGSAYFELTLTPAAGKQLVANAISFGSRSTGTGPKAYAVYTSVDNYASPVASGTLSANSAWALQSPSFTTVKGATGAAVTFRIYGYNGTGSPAASTANWRIDDLKLSALAATPAPEAPAIVSTSPTSGATGISPATSINITFNQPVTVGTAWFSIYSTFDGVMAASVTGGPSSFTLTPPIRFLDNDVVTVTLNASQISDQATGTLHPAADYSFTFTTAAPVAPSLGTQPQSQAVAEGGSASFSVTASGTAPFTYQWRKNGVALGGNATAGLATLIVSPVAQADAGSYDCVVSNAAGSVTSNTATLTISAVAPSIVAQPVAVRGETGGSVSFSVTASGTAPLTYQWRKDGVALTDASGISGSQTATLLVSNLSAQSAGSYDVVVSNTAGSATSASATLAVAIPGLNTVLWKFDTATPTSGLPSDVTGGTVIQGNNNGTTTLLTTTSVSSGYTGASGTYNAGAAARIGALNQASGGSAYFEVTLTPATGRQLVIGSLAFGSRSTGTGPQAYAVFSSLDSFAAPVATGTMVSTSSWKLYSPVLPALNGATDAAVTLRIYGYNGTGSPATSTANWRIDDLQIGVKTVLPPAVAPSIESAPSGLTLTVGESAQLSVTASGTAPLAYQWYKDGNALDGATSATLSIPSVFVADAGAYTVKVSNVAGEALSAPAELAVAKAAVAVTLTGLSQVYDGSPKAVSASSALPGLALAISYAGSADAPVHAGSYAVVASVVDANYFGSATGTLVVQKAPVSLSLGALEQVYDGSPKSITVAGLPSGASASILYDGSEQAPTAAGSYAVAASVSSPDYSGSASGQLVIAKAKVSVDLANLQQTYDGTPKAVTASTTPVGLKVALTYDGKTEAPTDAGTYAVSATIDEANYSGSALASLKVAKASTNIALSGLVQLYDGTPRTVTAVTVPAELKVKLTYNGAADAPTYPGLYTVVATIDDTNRSGTATDTLQITTSAVVRHAPVLNGQVDGSVQVLQAESLTLNGSAAVTGDILIPGTPNLTLNGRPTFVGTKDGLGNATPNNYWVTLNGGAVLRYLVRKTDAVTMPTVSAPPSPTGTRSVSLNKASDPLGNPATVRDLTLNGNGISTSLPAGSYGYVTLNGNNVLTLGVAGSTTPTVYNLQGLTLNGSSQLRLAGPVILTVANGIQMNSSVGESAHPEWLSLRVANGGVTLNGSVRLWGSVTAPNGTVTINGSTILTGLVVADRLTINGNGLLKDIE